MNTSPSLLLLVVLASLFLGCADIAVAGSPRALEEDNIAQAIEHRVQNRRKLMDVRNWCYFINEPDISAIAASEYDLAVIDYSLHGDNESAFSKAQISKLQSTGKLVLAYLSIGEAETYRYYWQMNQGASNADWSVNPPTWLGPENPDWGGNYKVQYWHAEWQQLIVHNEGGHAVLGSQLSYLDKIINAGFDGVFLDVIDAFEFYGPEGDGGNNQRPDAAAEMAAFIGAISKHAKSVDSEFIICQQNGENLVSPDLERPLTELQKQKLLDSVDHLSLEDVFYQGDEDANNECDPVEYRIIDANRFRDAGKLVTVIDYFDKSLPAYDSKSLDGFFEKARAQKWLPYAGPRELNRIGP